MADENLAWLMTPEAMEMFREAERLLCTCDPDAGLCTCGWWDGG
jgi:hypothetical protein